MYIYICKCPKTAYTGSHLMTSLNWMVSTPSTCYGGHRNWNGEGRKQEPLTQSNGPAGGF